MGKAQSKRSVDITTDPKKDGVIEEGTGEMKKIEDVDQLKPQVNGDTHHNENEEKDKVAADTTGETENEKDLSTEKEQPTTTIDAKAQVEGAGDASLVTPPIVTAENGGDELLDESKNGAGGGGTDTSTAETPDSSKKPKKEKVKKKWSFRSISFGKKDKQKPSKKDDANTSAVNGECEKVPEETAEEPTGEKKDEIANTATTAAAAATESSTETPVTAEGEAAAAASTVVTPESPKEETVTTASAVTVEKPTETSAGIDIVVPITNGTTTATTADTKIEEEIAESLAAVKINENIDENIEKIAVPELNKTEEEEEKAKDEIISTPTVTATVAAPVVVDEVITTNGDNHNDDIKTNGDNNDVGTVEATITTEPSVVVSSSPKLNGSSESPKIEVKEDIIETTTNIIDAVIVNNNNSSINENIIVAQTDIINKEPLPLSISTPPPPLPCSPPPSQVMVFALSDIKNQNSTTNNDQKQTEQQQATGKIDINNEKDDERKEIDKLEDPIHIVYEKLATTIEECIPTPESILPEEIINKIENIKEIECKLPVIPQEIEQKIPENQSENIKNLENQSINLQQQELIEMEQHTTQIPEEELTKNELIIPETIDIPISNNDQPQDVSTRILQEIDIEQHSSQIADIELSKNEVIIPEINEISSKLKSETETITNLEKNNKKFSCDNDLPTPPPSPIQEMSNDEIDIISGGVANDNSTNTKNVIDLGIESSLDLDKMTGSNEILLITAEQGVQVNDGAVSQQEKEQQQQQQNKQKQQQHKKNKENGVGENHADTTATESLNGVEHKTIEEIKAENQQIEKIVPSEVTQESATVAE